MFWRKKTEKQNAMPSVSVATIPVEFYAGTTPDIVFETAPRLRTTSSKKGVVTDSDKRAFDKATAAGASSDAHPASLLSNRRTFIVLFVVVFFLGSIGAGVYYYLQSRPQAPSIPNVPETTEQPVAAVEPPIQTLVEPPLATTTPPTAPVANPDTTTFTTVSEALGDSIDGDKDGSSDVEEELFKTDATTPDTDADGYIDSHEVYNLYNPIGREPERLIDSGLVTNFVHPTYGYQMYYPVSWAVGNVDPNFQDVLFSTFTGEYIRVKIFNKDPQESFASFLTRQIPVESVTSYVPFTTVFKEQGFRRKDFAVYVFLHDTVGVIISYEMPPEGSLINYRTVVKMMARSFRFGPTTVSIPSQIKESTVSGVVTSTPTSTLKINPTSTPKTATTTL